MITENTIWDVMKEYLQKLHPCIVCGSIDLELFAKKYYLEAKFCNSCSMISTNPHFSQDGLDVFYGDYLSNRLEKQEAMDKRDKAYIVDRDWICNFISSGKVLDIGSSGGFFLSKFSSNSWDREGVEVGQDAHDFAKENFGLPIHTGMFVDMDFDPNYDLLMMRGVLEHLINPIEVLNKCYAILKPGGYLFITALPAGDSFAFHVYREKWIQFTPLEHIHFFSKKTLTMIAEKIGFEFVAHHYQYDETPYANIEKDYNQIIKDIKLINSNQREDISTSPPFPGTMLTILFKKV